MILSQLKDFSAQQVDEMNMPTIAVVIPCYKVRNRVLDVISQIGSEVCRIYVVDDCCPEGTGDFVGANCCDKRVLVLKNDENQGVGGAVIKGYQAALEDGMEIIVKVDGDGQMDPKLIPDFIRPIFLGEADYTKGNRFYDLEKIQHMPAIRIFGNAILSFMTKLSSGYWNLFDPTNGYTAVHRDVVRHIPFKKISKRYFFETDMLFRLNILRAVVIDIPMDARYGDEISSLKIPKIITEFFVKHIRNFVKRIFYQYYLRDMSISSIELPIGILLVLFGLIYGGVNWFERLGSGVATPAGTVMVSALPIILGTQFILSFFNYDMSSVPETVFHKNRFFDDKCKRY